MLGKLLLLSVPVVAVLIVLAIWGVVYLTDTRPREYMKEWALSLGEPNGFQVSRSVGDSKWYYVEYQASCIAQRCTGSTAPGNSLQEWLSGHGFPISVDQLAECFQHGCTRKYYHEGHPVHLEVAEAFVNVQKQFSRYAFSLKMYWSD